MTTFGTMIDRIEDEIQRTDINSNVQDAIKSAIRHYQHTRFWFTEGNNAGDSVTTGSSNTATYTISNEWIDIDSLTITASGNEYQLVERTSDWFREVNTNPSTVTGVPTDYAFHDNAFWLYPSPNSAYPLIIYGHRRITALDSAGDVTLTATTVTSAWFTHGEELIRNRSKYYLYADVLESQERAAFFLARDRDAFDALKSKTDKKISTGIISPEWI